MSSVNKKYTSNIKGVISVDDGKITVSVSDVGDVDLADFIKDFTDKEDVKITVSYSEQIV